VAGRISEEIRGRFNVRLSPTLDAKFL